MESRHCGQDKRIFLCPVHNASTPCSLQAFGIRCVAFKQLNLEARVRIPRLTPKLCLICPCASFALCQANVGLQTVRGPNLYFMYYRHLLLSAGPLFTDDLWQIVCDGLKETIQATLSNMKDMICCFQPGSGSVSGDEGMSVRVVARRDSTHNDLIRLQQVAEQVWTLLYAAEIKTTLKKSKPFHYYAIMLSQNPTSLNNRNHISCPGQKV